MRPIIVMAIEPNSSSWRREFAISISHRHGRKREFLRMASVLPFLVLLALFVIPLVYRQRFRSASKRAAVWLKPDGDGFIFHPFGRRGRAYLVSNAAADLIKARLVTRTKIFYGVLLAAIVPSLIFASLDPSDYVELRPYLSLARIAVLAFAIIGIWVWHRLAIHPLYADAPESSVRIPVQEVRIKQAANVSWGMILFSIIRLGLLAGGLVWYGLHTHHPMVAGLLVLPLILATRTIRTIYFKLQPAYTI
jgi:hypothetical protein